MLDGRRIVFASNRHGAFDLYLQSAAGEPELILKSSNSKFPSSFSSDGRLLLYAELDPKTKSDLWILPMEGERKPIPLLRTPFSESAGAFSPDGKWFAYTSDESGRDEIYIQPYPPSGAKVQVSKDGGYRPKWRRDGKEIYWLAEGGALWVAEVSAGAQLQTGVARRLFESHVQNTADYFAVTGDGKRFLIPKPVAVDTVRPVTLIQNWLAGAKR